MPLDLDRAARLQTLALIRQVAVESDGHGLDGCSAFLGLGGSGILAELGTSVQLASHLARTGSRDGSCGAQRHAPLLDTDAVLKDPTPGTTGAQPYAESGDLVIEV